MESRVVEGITHGRVIHVVAIAHTPTAVVIGLPRVAAIEVIYLADIVHTLAIRYGVAHRTDTAVNAITPPLRTAHAGETVDDEHFAFLLRCDIRGEGLALEAQTTRITCCYADVVACALLRGEGVCWSGDAGTIVPVAIVGASIYDIIGRSSSWFECVLSSLPSDFHGLCLAVDSHVIDWQRLYHILGAVLLVDELEEGLVHRT